MKAPLAFFLTITTLAPAFAEVHTMTLRQAMDRALEQNPDLVLSRLDQQRAQAEVDVTRDPFSTKVSAGSGLAYTHGFPTSIDGSQPSVGQVRINRAIYDKAIRLRVDASRESERGAGIDVSIKQEDIAYNVYSAFLDAEQAARSVAAVQQQIQSLDRVKQLVDVRVSEGSELPVSSRQANVNLLKARRSLLDFEEVQRKAEASLAQLLGFPHSDLVRPAQEQRALEIPENEANAVTNAIAENPQVRRLQSNLTAKQLEMNSYQAERLPKVNLVAQGAVLAKYNNYDVYFKSFQRFNYQIGASIEIPIFLGSTAKARLTQAQIDIQKIQVELDRTRNRIGGDVQQAYADVHRAESARDLARADLDLAREQLSVDLAQYDEQKVPMSQVEAARATEQEKWLTYYDSQRTLELARLNVVRTTGSVVAALR